MEKEVLKVFVYFFMFVFLFSSVSALCTEGQIDINTASAEDLDKIKWVGPSTAQSIIEYRNNQLFSSLDDLVNISYITLNRIEEIKAEGLACVDEESQISSEEEFPDIQGTPVEEKIIEEPPKDDNKVNEISYEIKGDGEVTGFVSMDTIELNPKVIKTKDVEEYNLYAVFGLVVFSALLAFLFIIKWAVTRKNEFN